MPYNAPSRFAIRAGDLTLISEFTIIRIWELPAEMALAQNNENLLPFIPLMKGGGEHLDRCAQSLSRIEDETRQRTLSLHFVSMGSLRYNRESLIQLLARETMQLEHILRETPYIQHVVAEAREEAREEGREEGQRLILVELLLNTINKRFPNLDVKADVERVLNIDALKQIFVEFDQIPDADELRRRLAALAPTQHP